MTSSRTRTPDRPALEPTTILEAALRIVDAEGKDKLTVRRLAQELDVSPMAIYWHFENKAALERRMVEHVVTGASFDDVPREPAEAFLRETFGRMHRGLAEHPGLIPLLQDPVRIGEHARSVMDRVLEVLEGVGLAKGARLEAYYVLMSFTLGSVTMDHASEFDPRRSPFARGLDRLIALVLAPIPR